MDLGLRGKSVVVTGAGSGIGRSIALRLGQERCTLTLVSRDPERLQDTAQLVARFGGPVTSLAADLTARDTPHQVAELAQEKYGSVYGLVACSGSPPFGAFDVLDDSMWEAAFHQKFLASVRVIRAVRQKMHGDGRVVVIAGNTATAAGEHTAASGAMNAALSNLVTSLARRFGRDGIRFVCVNPGPTRTERLEALLREMMSITGQTYAEVERSMTSRSADQRFGEPEEVAAIVAFAMSPLASHMNGVAITVDGGVG